MDFGMNWYDCDLFRPYILSQLKDYQNGKTQRKTLNSIQVLRRLMGLAILCFALDSALELILNAFWGRKRRYGSQRVVGPTEALSTDHRERASPSAIFLRN